MSIQNREIHRLKQQLDYTFSLSSKLPEETIELQSHWAKYLCIQLSGFLEISVRTIFNQYIVDNSSPKIQNYVSSKLKNFQNPKSAKISELAGTFDISWRRRLESDDLEKLRQHIDSIVTNRNQIAHGNDTPGLRLSRVKEWYPSTVQYIKKLEEIVK